MAPTVAPIGSLERFNDGDNLTPYAHDNRSTRFKGTAVPPGGYSPSVHGSSKFRTDGANKSQASLEYCGFENTDKEPDC